MRSSRTVALLVALLLAVAAGCGDDDGGADAGDASGLSDEEQAYVDVAVDGFDAERDAPMTEDDARCIATSMIEGVGVERLEEMGITPESFSQEGDLPEGAVSAADAETLVDGIATCVDFRDLFLAGFVEDGSLTEEAKACLAEQFDEDLVKRSMVVLLSEGEDALSDDTGAGAEMMAAFLACPGALE